MKNWIDWASADPTMITSYEELLDRLVKEQVKFALVGGLACMSHFAIASQPLITYT